jgi:fibronectin-binding autotransporter adhesin
MAAMKVAATRRIWRPLRCLVILVCAGGAVLAADNSWKTSLPFIGENQFVDWFAALTGTGSREANIALPAEPERSPNVQSALSRWTERSIFYQPSHGWTLDAARSAGLPLSKTQSNSAPMSFAQSITGPYSSSSFSSDLVGSSGASSSVAPASPSGVDGTWASTVSGNWSTTGNWSAGVVADGAGASAHFDAVNIATGVTVTLDTSRTIGNLYIGDTDGTHSYTISPSAGSTLTFDDNSSDFSVHSILQQTSTSAGDTIAANILVKNDLEINNLSATQVFTISGNVASSATNFSSQTLRFNNTANAAGDIVMSGNLSNGSANGQLNLVVLAGTVTLTGTNTYTGYTEVEGGTLLINGNNSGVSNNVYVDGGGTLGGQGTIGKTVYAFGGTITGATATTVGTLTLLSDVVLHTGETEGGTYLANLSGSTSDLLAITGNLILGSDTTLDIVGNADGLTTYVLATFAGHTGQFGSTTGVPAGYTLVYNADDIELVPTAIPEPATWIGGALTLGGLVFARRKRKR